MTTIDEAQTHMSTKDPRHKRDRGEQSSEEPSQTHIHSKVRPHRTQAWYQKRTVYKAV